MTSEERARGELNTEHDRAILFDVHVVGLKRADALWAAVLGCGVDPLSLEGFEVSVLEHDEGTAAPSSPDRTRSARTGA